MLKLLKKVPEVGFYYHYKRDPEKGIREYAYEFCGIGFQTENDECFANYRPLFEEAAVYQASIKLRVPVTDERPLDMWMEYVTKDDKTFPRFKIITDPEVIAKLEIIKMEMYP